MAGELKMDIKEKLMELLDIMFNSEYCIDKTEAADFLIANGVTVQEWISVKEHLPQEKVNCIVHYKHAYCDNDDYSAIGFCFYDGEKFQFDPAHKVTHWMPLPPAPEDMK